MQNLLIFLLISAAIESRQVLFDQLPGQLTDAQTANLKDLYDRFMITMNPFSSVLSDFHRRENQFEVGVFNMAEIGK